MRKRRQSGAASAGPGPDGIYAAGCGQPALRVGEGTLRTIVVSHPVYGSFRAVGVKDKLRAVQAAAKAWGGLQWSKIAKECDFTDDLDADR